MKLALIALLLLAALFLFALSRRRQAAREEADAAAAAARARARKPRVPTVSNNLKGVTASQTIEPLRPGSRPAEDPGEDR